MNQKIIDSKTTKVILNGDDIPASVEVAAKDQAQTEPVCQPQKYTASIYVAPSPYLPSEFVTAVSTLEEMMGKRIFLLIQNIGDKFTMLDDELFAAFLKSLDDLPCEKPIAILIDSPGGYANFAYKIATFFNSQCGGFTAVVPRYAKSAATLLTLGAKSILLGRHAELGPLDAQFDDPERETSLSALDEVQALERLHASALEAADRTMFLLLRRTGKKIDSLLPLSLDFAAKMIRPLLENIDAVHYTQMARALKVAEEYASRLLQNRYPVEKAIQIARHLVEKYPQHEFVIDAIEATRIDPELVTTLPMEQQKIINQIIFHLTKLTAIGYLKEIPSERTFKRIYKPISSNTRDAVETAIDLSKEGLHATWEGRVKEIKKAIERWTESDLNQTSIRHR